MIRARRPPRNTLLVRENVGYQEVPKWRSQGSCPRRRAAAGLALILLGFFVIGGTAGTVLGLIGLVPVAAGIFNFCLLGPLVGGYFDGRKNLEGVPPAGRRGSPQH